MSRRLQLRHVEVASPVHRLRAETKVLALLGASSTLAFVPQWSVIALGSLATVAVFVLSRLPAGVLAPPPPVFIAVIGFSAVLSLLAGGDPTVAGLGLGGLLDLARLVSLGIVLVSYAALLTWTTPPADIGLGLGRMVRPLRRIGVPAEELATAIALTVRSLPLIADELRIADDARRTRPPTRARQRPLADLVDLGAIVTVGAHRRARELARTMVARGSTIAPSGDPRPIGPSDVLALALVAVAAAAVFVWL